MDANYECVLLIESDADTTTFAGSAISYATVGLFPIERANSLSTALERLCKGGVKAILLNLFLSDSQGIDTFNKLYAIECHIPILVLTDTSQENLAMLAIQSGAEDYLLADHVDAYSLSRAIRNVLERRIAEDALYIEKERAQVTLNSIGDGVISSDINGNITYLNAAAERITGWLLDDAKGLPFAQVFHIVDGDTHIPLDNPINRAIKEDKPVILAVNSVLIRHDGTEIAVEDSTAPIRTRNGFVTGAVIIFRDVSESRAMVQKLAHLAQYDFLTDLPNRALLNDRLEQTIALARRGRQQLAVLFIDIDRFKNINDTLGHTIGDKLLQSVAQRLTMCVRDSDTISRQGGDEFIVLLSNVENAKAAGYSAAKILAAQAAKHCLDKHELNITLSIGISIFPDDGENAETMLRNADAAMYHAKENGRNNFQFFKQEMNDSAIERQALEHGLRDALERNEFVLHYQPKFNLESGEITGVEALIRWQHPLRGLLCPKHFVPIAEDSGLIVPIGQWMLREACRQTQAWQNAGLLPTPIAVNISAVEFRREDFLPDMCKILHDTGLDPHYLEIELTESMLVQDIESTMTVLNALKNMGVQMAIDDFGTGYSSLSSLRQFPINTLKIDQSFVRDISTDIKDATIVSAVIGMGNSLKLRVSAEGVETSEQLAFLIAERCEEGQGYFFSPPVDADTFANMLGTVNTKYVVN